MNWKFLLAGLIVLGLLFMVPPGHPRDAGGPSLVFDSGAHIQLEVFDTSKERARGLMGRRELGEDAGALFRLRGGGGPPLLDEGHLHPPGHNLAGLGPHRGPHRIPGASHPGGPPSHVQVPGPLTVRPGGECGICSGPRDTGG
ncbi:MAG: DUF192 domain-containing protein [Euryarchaeota archaeon]|nr:DUF192 domain-containing protein [Euryarchaeota archaeon]